MTKVSGPILARQWMVVALVGLGIASQLGAAEAFDTRAQFAFVQVDAEATSRGGEFSGVPQESITTTVDSILGDPKYRHLRRPEAAMPNWLEKWLDKLFQPRDRGTSRRSSGIPMAKIFIGLAVAALIVGLVFLLIRVLTYVSEDEEGDPFLGLLGDEAINPTRPPGEVAVSEYEERALAAAAAGNHKAALRELVLGAMSWIERTGQIRYRKGRTNRDYIRAIYRDTARRDSLLTIVDAFERVYYGHRPAKADRFEHCLAAFRESFREEVADAVPAS